MTPKDITSAWDRVLHLWRPMAGWTLLVWAAAAVVLGPLGSWVLGRQIFHGPGGVVGNEAILAWLLTLPGLIFVLAAGGLALVGAVVRYAGLYHMVVDDLEGRSVGVRRTALRLLPRLPALFRLCVTTVVGGLLAALPLVLGLVAVWRVLLSAHDINYYLAVRPPEWHGALLAGGGWALLWAAAAAYLAGRCVLALPAHLDGHRPLRRAVRRAWATGRGRGRELLRLLGVAITLWLAARFLVALAFFHGAWLLVEGIAQLTSSLRTLALAVAAYTAGSFALDAAAGFLGFSLVSTIVTKFYYVDTELHAAAPPAPRLSEVPARLRRLAHPLLRPARLIPGLVLLLAGGVGAGGVLLERIPHPAPVEVHAHRGGPPPSPENTLAALERAIDAGADFAEIDVQRTRDGTVVVAHDADLMRVAGDPRRIAATDYGELAGLSQRPDDGSEAGERGLATLQEFLDRARGRIGLNIELKYYGWDAELAPEVVRIVRERGMTHEVVAMSLDLRGVRQLRELAPELRVGFVSTVAVGDPTALDVDFLAVPTAQATRAFLRDARERGVRVHAWTVNDPQRMVRLIERGIHGIITDDPALAVRVERELAELPAASRLLLVFRGMGPRRPGRGAR